MAFRIRSSWWAPWAVLALAAAAWLAIGGIEHGQSWLAFVPLVVFLGAVWGYPPLARRSWAGLRSLPAASQARYVWRTRLDAGEEPQLRYARRHQERLPRLVSVTTSPRPGGGALVLVAESFPWRDAQTRWIQAGAGLAHALDRAIPRVELIEKGTRVRLTFPVGVGGEVAELPRWRDIFPKAWPGDLERVPIGRGVDGEPVTMALLYSHAFVYGATGSGKGSVIWSVVGALAGGIPQGLVEFWGIDPKGGMEFSLGEEIFTRLADGDDQVMMSLLTDFRAEVDARAQHLRAEGVRKFVPSPGRPLKVLIIDEYLAVAVMLANPRDAKKAEKLLLGILSQGRAVGFTVIGAAQLAQKAYLQALREMFPQQICLRTTSQAQTMMALEDALDHGALAHKIPDDFRHQGVGFFKRGSSVPVKLRFAEWTDADITAMESWVVAHRGEAAVQEDRDREAMTVEEAVSRRGQRRQGEVQPDPALQVEAEPEDEADLEGESPPAPGTHLGPGDLGEGGLAGPEQTDVVERAAPKRERVRAYLEALPQGEELPSVRVLAAATGVSVGLATSVRAAFSRERSVTVFSGSPVRSFAPQGDPTEHVKSAPRTEGGDAGDDTVFPDPTAPPTSADPTFGVLP